MCRTLTDTRTRCLYNTVYLAKTPGYRVCGIYHTYDFIPIEAFISFYLSHVCFSFFPFDLSFCSCVQATILGARLGIRLCLYHRWLCCYYSGLETISLLFFSLSVRLCDPPSRFGQASRQAGRLAGKLNAYAKMEIKMLENICKSFEYQSSLYDDTSCLSQCHMAWTVVRVCMWGGKKKNRKKKYT